MTTELWLFVLQVQRIPEYDKYLNDLLDETDAGHPDYEELSRASTRVKNVRLFYFNKKLY